MLKRSTAHNPKLSEASNAMYTTYQDFSKDLKRFGFVKKVKNAREKFQLPKRMN